MIVEHIRNSIEIVHSQEYSKFLSSVFPSLCYLLQNIPPQFQAETVSHVCYLNVRKSGIVYWKLFIDFPTMNH
jgi:hypothetical protein